MKLLEGKNAVIYGAAGGVGSAVAKAFAREGATVFLSGRNLSSLQKVAQEISKTGGNAKAAQVDALDPGGVEDHLRGIVADAGRIDISFNLISSRVGMGRALTQLTGDQFDQFAFTNVRSNFLTATAAARRMEKQGSGVILALTASVARIPKPNLGFFPMAGAALEALCRQLALEAGPKGVRVVCLRTGGTPDNPVLQEVYAELARVRGTTKDEVEASEARNLALKRLPLLPEVANAAVLLASDYASAITATVADASCGDIVD
jgi:3-oxoacyl-[acyl-carrier protein] reductase